ncbi:odorant receptor 46a-like isoform X2 [Leptopilina boulardi]|uniref:odorant receptor 46a-like isoform X2 n=1 Tax=Leptopilina boulardi TaxID=63433 RepID=UPI0021F5DD58|nr:odorant receptor 46a-like isoform X2 [Leptopilina boulardi]
MIDTELENNLRFLMNLLKVNGYWPFINKKKLIMMRTFYFFVIMSLTVPIGINLYKARHNMDYFCECVSMAAIIPLGWISYYFQLSKTSTLRSLFTSMFKDYETFQINKYEYEILLKFAKKTQFFVMVYLDFIIPLNESRQKYFSAELDYIFFDKYEYYMPVSMHLATAGLYIIHLIVLADAILLTFARHACAMFCILRYRLKTINVNAEGERIDHDYDQMYKNVRGCAILHSRILLFLDDINSCYAMCLLIFIGVTVIIMSFHGSMMVLKQHDLTYLIKGLVIAVGQSIHVFLNCLTGQMVQTQSANLCNYIYNFEWYEAQEKVKMSIYFMILKSETECNLYVGKTAVLGLELFSTIMKTIFSYLNVLNSRN